MTERERKQRRKIKKQLQEEGVLPPDKPRLNRKKYIEETKALWDGRDRECYVWDVHIFHAIGEMLEYHDRTGFKRTLSKEAVGVARMLRLALRFKEFSDKLRSEGRTEYTVGEMYEFVKDVYE